MKDTIRLKQSNKAALEATGYNDANEAIAAMLEENKALHHKLDVAKGNKTITEMLQNVTTPTVANYTAWCPDEAYWARFRDEVREATKPGKILHEFPGIVPASTLRTIGKIEPGERLEEPVGRQGREAR